MDDTSKASQQIIRAVVDLLVAKPTGKTVKQRLSKVEGDENHYNTSAQQ
jgi:hypothetical protein